MRNKIIAAVLCLITLITIGFATAANASNEIETCPQSPRPLFGYENPIPGSCQDFSNQLSNADQTINRLKTENWNLQGVKEQLESQKRYNEGLIEMMENMSNDCKEIPSCKSAIMKKYKIKL